MTRLFQSTHPVRGATAAVRSISIQLVFQSTHPVRGATADSRLSAAARGISIHAPRAGCDPGDRPGRSHLYHFNPRTPCGVRPLWMMIPTLQLTISIHAPRAGCDTRPPRVSGVVTVFQSTHPVRGATALCGGVPAKIIFQSTHPVRGATATVRLVVVVTSISIHAPRAGCDPKQGAWGLILYQFQSTHPVRGATKPIVNGIALIVDFNPRTPCGVRRSVVVCRFPKLPHFNPRTPCGVRHNSACRRKCHAGNFNPRTPCGVRRSAAWACPRSRQFQSTHPVRGATISFARCNKFFKISIHAPRAGCDEDEPDEDESPEISIHAPRAGCDSSLPSSRAASENFNPRTPCGVRRLKMYRYVCPALFQSTHPVRGATRKLGR